MTSLFKFIKILPRLFRSYSLLFAFLSCTHSLTNLETFNYNESDFLKGKALVTAKNYNEAIPFLKKSLEKADDNYGESLLLLGRVYDQTENPEQSLLALNEYLQRTRLFKKNEEFEIQARSLIFKNELKLNPTYVRNPQKNIIDKILHYSSTEKNFLEKSLEWSTDFLCEKYCLEEMTYLKQAQFFLIYSLEGSDSRREYSFNQLINKYHFFHEKISQKTNKKELSKALFDSLQVLKKLSLEQDSKKKLKEHAKLSDSLNEIEKDLERWSVL